MIEKGRKCPRWASTRVCIYTHAQTPHVHIQNTRNETEECLAKLACHLAVTRQAPDELSLLRLRLPFRLAPIKSCLTDGCHLAIMTLPLLICILNLDEHWVGSQVLKLKRSSEKVREL